MASIVLEHGGNEDEAIAALLHDAIEDAPPELGADWVRRWIQFRFGRLVLAIVEGCTDADVHPKPNWRARKEAYVERMAREPRSVLLVSIADKLRNARALVRDYRDLGDDLWKRFNPDAGMAGTLGYYHGLVEAYRATGYHSRLVRELKLALDDLELLTGHEPQWPLPS